MIDIISWALLTDKLCACGGDPNLSIEYWAELIKVESNCQIIYQNAIFDKIVFYFFHTFRKHLS